MKPKALLPSLLVTSLLAFDSLGGPLRTSDVPENPAWIAHVDCEALRANNLGKFILAEMDKPENQPKIAIVTAIFGVDLRTQIHGLTFYAVADSSHEPLLLLYGEFDTNRLVTLAKSAQEYDATEQGRYTIHSWLDNKRKKRDGSRPRVYAALPNGGLIIFGPKREAVAAALDVLDNKTANLSANGRYSELLKSDPGTFVQAAARKIELPHSDAHKAILSLTTHARVQIREADQQISAELSLGAKDEEVAKNMLSIAQGITGLAKAQQERPKAAKLAEKVNVRQDGTELSVTFAVPSDQVVDFLKSVAARKNH
jgi:hypothetical protein